ncbi:MAG: TonB-dependent receptor [Bryobacterales bacterium]|nr:TonB-dependent receptor [Bryobacteraceae bacterium]MDW8356095.1 TonB-dependent receptor [Bryobacterales bacterium]
MRQSHFLLLLLALTPCLQAQQAASVTGSVQDPQGRAIAGARLRIARLGATGDFRTAADSGGRFRFEQIPAGTVYLEVSAEGFRDRVEVLNLEAGRTAQLELRLEVAGVSQTVMVTATATPQTTDEIAKATSLLTKEEMDLRDEFSLAEAIRPLPGVLVNNGGGPGQFTTIRIRGVRPDAAAVLVDGLRFRDASTTQGDASSFVSTLNLVGAERVELLRGSASSLYGTNAVGGAINVITSEGGSPMRGNLSVEGGGLGFLRGRGGFEGGLLKNQLRYSANLLHLNVTRGVDGNDANRSTGGQFFARADLGSRTSLSGRLWASDDFVQLNISPGTTGLPAANFPADGVIPARILPPDQVRLLLAGGAPNLAGITVLPGRDDPDNRRSSRFSSTALILRHLAGPRMNFQASYQRVHTSRVFENGPAGIGSQPAAVNYGNYVGDIDTADGRVNAVPLQWLQFSGGFEWEQERYFDRQDNNLAGTRRVATQTRITQRSSAVYFASQAALLKRRLLINASGRGQLFELDRPRFQLSGTANNYDRVAIDAPPKALTGDLSLAYLIPSLRTKLRVHGGNSYRAPSLYERFGGGFSANPVTGVVQFTPYGDPLLLPDRYNSVDAGVDQYFWNSRLRLSATWYYIRVVSITAFDSSGAIRPETDPYLRTMGYINGSGGISRGAEFGFEVRPARSFTLTGSYTYTNANLDRDITVRGFWRVLQVPRHYGSVVVLKRWGRRLDTNLDLYRQGEHFNSYFAVNRSRAFRFPGFTKVDLTAGFRIWESEKRFARLFTRIENALNRTYYQNAWQAPGLYVVAGIQLGN